MSPRVLSQVPVCQGVRPRPGPRGEEGRAWPRGCSARPPTALLGSHSGPESLFQGGRKAGRSGQEAQLRAEPSSSALFARRSLRADSRGEASRRARGWTSRGRLGASASLVMAHGCSSTVDPAVSPAGPSGLACSHRGRRAASDCGRGEEGRACAAGGSQARRSSACVKPATGSPTSS